MPCKAEVSENKDRDDVRLKMKSLKNQLIPTTKMTTKLLMTSKGSHITLLKFLIMSTEKKLCPILFLKKQCTTSQNNDKLTDGDDGDKSVDEDEDAEDAVVDVEATVNALIEPTPHSFLRELCGNFSIKNFDLAT